MGLFAAPTNGSSHFSLLREPPDEGNRIEQAVALHRPFEIKQARALAEFDLDLLVDWTPQTSLFDVGGLITDLQELLGKRVDVISAQQLHPRFRPRVLAQARPV